MEHILKEELAVTHAEAGLLFSAPILMTAVVALPAGRVVDRIGLAFTFIYGVGFGWSFATLPKLVSSGQLKRNLAWLWVCSPPVCRLALPLAWSLLCPEFLKEGWLLRSVDFNADRG